MDAVPDPAQIPPELIEIVRGDVNWRRLCQEWDRMYPQNPVLETEEASHVDDEAP